MSSEKSQQSFRAVLRELRETGWIRNVTEVDAECYCATVQDAFSYNDIAKLCSEKVGGMWSAMANGVRWNNSRETFFIYKNSSKLIDELTHARSVCEGVTGKRSALSWGSIARAYLQFATFESAKLPDAREKMILSEGGIGYHQCIPCRVPHATLYDGKGFYFQLISRLPSPRLRITDNDALRFEPLTADEKFRWREVLECVAEQKLVRNSVWGAMLGSSGGKICWHKGVQKRSRAYRGVHAAAGALVARTAWEVTQLQCSELTTIYSQTDSVATTTRDAEPAFWKKLGLQYKIEAQGEAHVLGQHRYRIGGKVTEWYQEDDRWLVGADAAKKLSRYLWAEWL